MNFAVFSHMLYEVRQSH